ncbi:MAG: O-antigen ligase family protein, partial [Chthoniobacterales bacterium]
MARGGSAQRLSAIAVVHGPRRTGEYLVVAAVAASLILTQVLIGGRAQLFALPGCVLLACAALVAAIIVPRRNPSVDPLCLASTTLLFGYIVGRSLLSPAGYFARSDLYSALAAVVLYGMVATLLTRASRRVAVVVLLLAFAMLHVFVGLLQFTHGDNFMLIPQLQRADYGQRASGFYVCPNHLAGLLEVLALFGLSLTLWSRFPIWAKLVIGYLTGICFVGVALTGSRGGYLSVLGGLAVFVATSVLILSASPGRRLARFVGIGCVVSIAVIAAVTIVHQNAFLRGRAADISDGENVRLPLWRAAIEQWKLQTIFGTGSGTYRFYGRQFRDTVVQNDPVDVHNDYLHLLCEYGIAGAAAFLIFFVAHARRGLKAFRELRAESVTHHLPCGNRLSLNIAALCSLAAYVIHSALDFNLHVPANALLLAFVFALLANPHTRARTQLATPHFGILCRATVVLVSLVLLAQAIRLLPGEYLA